MTVIKNLAFIDKNKLKNLNSFVESELDLSAFYPFPVDILHHFLPFKLKFLNESFVAIEDKKICGLITINKINSKRVKITRLLLDENSLLSGKLLVDYTVTAFLSKGAESFYVVINKKETPLIKMFKEGLGFKNYAKEFIYKIDNKNLFLGLGDMNFDHIRKMQLKDVEDIKNLINGAVHSYQKATFFKNSTELKINFLKNINQYVLFDKNKIYGYFTILILNNKTAILDFVLMQGYEAYSMDIIQFTKVELFKNKKIQALYIKLKSFYSNFSELSEILNLEYKNPNESEILVKDFLITRKQESPYGNMIFNDVTPAF